MLDYIDDKGNTALDAYELKTAKKNIVRNISYQNGSEKKYKYSV